MKALVYTAPRKLEFKDWPDPELAAGEALVRIQAAAVCGSDLHGWLGHSRGRVPPLILGHEVAGEVVEIRESKTALKPGQPVTVYPLIGCGNCVYCVSGRDYLCPQRKLLGMHVAGAFAEYLRVPAANLDALPEGLDISQGSLVESLACGIHMVRLAATDTGVRDDLPLVVEFAAA